jgi:hypothetical protein
MWFPLTLAALQVELVSVKRNFVLNVASPLKEVHFRAAPTVARNCAVVVLALVGVEEEVVEFVFHRKERHFGKVQKISTTIRKKCFFPSLTSYFVYFFLMKSTSTYTTTINRLITFLVMYLPKLEVTKPPCYKSDYLSYVFLKL